MNRSYAELTEELGLWIDPKVRVRDLSIAQRQLVEILKALARRAKLLIFDEPTAALDINGRDALFQCIHRLVQKGKAVVFISHYIEDVFTLADTITVLRDGQVVSSGPAADTNANAVITQMLGRTLIPQGPDDTYIPATANPLLVLKQVTNSSLVNQVPLEVYAGEVLGVGGLVGSGIEQVANILSGQVRTADGMLILRGQPITLRGPRSALRAGIGFVPSDRKTRGLLLRFPVDRNISLTTLRRLSRWGVIRRSRERSQAVSSIAQLDIRAASELQLVRDLSGGNQQKVLLARLLAASPELLVLHEPMQGVDAGAKQESFSQLRILARSGRGVVVISSDFKALAEGCDRCVILSNGRVAGTFTGSTLNEANLMRTAVARNTENNPL